MTYLYPQNKTITTTHTEWGTGLNNSEVFRFSIPANKRFVLESIQIRQRTGGFVDEDFTVDVYDETNSESIGSCNLNQSISFDSVCEGPSSVIVRITNNTEDLVEACFDVQGEIR